MPKINPFKRINSSFGIKIGIALLALTVFATGSAVFFIYIQTYNMVMELMGDRLKDIGRTGTYLFTEEDREAIKRLKVLAAKDMGNANALTAGIKPGGYAESIAPDRSKEIMKGKDFQRIVQNLRQIKAASRKRLEPLRYLQQIQPEDIDLPLVRYCYIFTDIPEVPDKSILMFVADADYESRKDEPGSPIGNLYVAEGQKCFTTAFTGIASAEEEFYEEQMGTLLASAVPIFDNDGSVIAVLGLDLDVTSQANKLRDLLRLCITVFVLVLIASVLFAFLLTKRIITPIRSLRAIAERVRNRDFSVRIENKRSDELGMLAETFNSMVTEIRDYSQGLEELNAAYFRFVPKEFLEHLGVEGVLDIKLGDQVQKEMSILFSDIRSFTTLSEGLNPDENFNLLNAYLEKIAPLIRANNGFIDKYIGDAIMALFSGNSREAIHAAVDMRRTLRDFNRFQDKNNLPKINIGVGIHTGNLMLGTIGEQMRMQTTVISDSVNLASRLEGLTKKFQTPIIVSEQTMKSAIEADDILSRYLGRVMVKGKKKSVAIYEVFSGESQEYMEKKIQTKPAFEEALANFFDGRMGDSAKLFKSVLEKDPNDFAARIYLDKSKGNSK